MGFTTPLVVSLLLGLTHCLAASVPEQLIEEAKQHHCGDGCSEVGIATASLNVRLHGTGAHRHLLYRLTVHCTQQLSGDRRDGDPAAASLPPPASCAQVAVLQPLPPAVFADIYQLDNAAALGLGPPVRLFGQVDVESIERFAQSTVLAVYSSNHSAAPGQADNWLVLPFDPSHKQAGNTCSDIVLEVPLHARYPHPRQSQHLETSWAAAVLSTVAAVAIAPPLVLVRCPAAVSTLGSWQAASMEHAAMEADQAAVQWDMPAGNLRHGSLVASVTAGAIACGTAAVLWALLMPRDCEQPVQQFRMRGRPA
ncbi:hypothetical protein ACK3TF_000876 [Chlorella vulgaris]